MNVYKVITRTSTNAVYRVFQELDTLAEALTVAARLERNTDLEALVELPNNEIQQVPLSLLELTA